MDGAARRQAVTGPLGSYVAGFVEVLAGQGYSPYAVRLRLWQLDHVSRWLDRQGLGVHELTDERVHQFLADRRARGYRSWISLRSMELPVGYFRGIKVAPPPQSPVGAEEDLIEGYHRYLVAERGLAEATIKDYLRTARLFLSRCGLTALATEHVVLDWLDAGKVTTFVVRECTHREVSSAQYLLAGLRSLLRYSTCTWRGTSPRILPAWCRVSPAVVEARCRAECPRSGSRRCWLVATEPERSACATTPLCSSWPGWGCAAPRSRR